ncbi:hypothetical protein [Micromonospora sp. NPDC050200]|uniref:hypothetical protein n=1 Tax=Micromonospora sp. NPDC050200 TaxID=3155664 RepID=UPI0033FE64DF
MLGTVLVLISLSMLRQRRWDLAVPAPPAQPWAAGGGDGEGGRHSDWRTTEHATGAWSGASRNYLAQHGDTLPIREPFDEYTAAIEGLYKWMFAQSTGLDSAEIEAANTLIDEYNDVLTGRRP